MIFIIKMVLIILLVGWEVVGFVFIFKFYVWVYFYFFGDFGCCMIVIGLKLE